MTVSSSSGNKIVMKSDLEILMQKTDEHGSGLFESGEDSRHREKGTQSLQYSFQHGALKSLRTQVLWGKLENP